MDSKKRKLVLTRLGMLCLISSETKSKFSVAASVQRPWRRRRDGTGSGSQSFPELDHSGRTRWVRTGGNCITFTLLNEDHMLGNALQYMVMKNPDVEFCGYCITHPSESEINFQIQRGA
ncbi:DNA-directed RNA polymerases I and III subunit RPAC2-like [Melopsittacus undulatus]|uniref:DNA-directed RNA polymerases I and III subunit RPAC2-like n=1 Tax=Melopsittacus undulatus TaxID=13146 RepID=UPI00146B59E3|nr:DNA-directed RNA polymerases I and III subunit RPAC2-like [Melopsittacus undulatus]